MSPADRIGPVCFGGPVRHQQSIFRFSSGNVKTHGSPNVQVGNLSTEYADALSEAKKYIETLADKLQPGPSRSLLSDMLAGKNPPARTSSELGAVVSAFLSALQLHDASRTSSHQKRVMMISHLMGLELNYSHNKLKMLRIAAVLHDVGKLGVPFAVLNKKEKLTAAEIDVIHQHPVLGYLLLRCINFPPSMKRMVCDIALRHHLTLQPDKSAKAKGYPAGFCKPQHISQPVNIVTVADILDAQMSYRPYRDKQDSLRDILKNSFYENPAHYGAFDPQVLWALKKIKLQALARVMLYGRCIHAKNDKKAVRIIDTIDRACTLDDYMKKRNQPMWHLKKTRKYRPWMASYKAFETVYRLPPILEVSSPSLPPPIPATSPKAGGMGASMAGIFLKTPGMRPVSAASLV